MANELLYKKRFLKVQKILGDYNLDSIIVYGDYNQNSYLRWISNHQPLLFSYLYIDKKNIVLYEIDYLLFTVKKNKLNKLIKINTISEDNVFIDLKKICKNIKRLGVVGSAPYNHIKDINCFILDLNSVFDRFIIEKSDIEIKYISTYAKILSSILKNISSFIKVGKSLIDIEKVLRMKLLKYGNSLSFPISIVAGNTIKKTTVNFPTDYTIKNKDIVCIDAGIIKDGFASDATRCYFINNDKMFDYYKKLLKSHYDTISCIKADIDLYEILLLYKKNLRKNNLPDDTLEIADLGHGIGFYVHEFPFLYKKEYKDFKLINNMVLALEPEIMIDKYRLRVEDMILVKKDKSTILTS